jgi:hypothetical protein
MKKSQNKYTKGIMKIIQLLFLMHVIIGFYNVGSLTRVARFISTQYTKTGENIHTKWLQRLPNDHTKYQMAVK